MAIEIKDFESMVKDTLYRIINSTNITNINPGSVIRTIVESILSEVDIEYYQINQLATAMNIDTAVGEDLDNIIQVFGVTRNNATSCSATVTFGRSVAHTSDIAIPIGTTVSTTPDSDGNVVEFVVTQANAILPTGKLVADVVCTAIETGNMYIPAGIITVMNNPIINIEYITNTSAISGGTDFETDDDLRARFKSALASLGKGTIEALKSAVKEIDGVNDVLPLDRNRGVGTTDLVVVTDNIPPSANLQTKITDVINMTKAAGIDVIAVYPTIKNTDITVTTTGYTDAMTIKSGILRYMSTLNAGNSLIIGQMERFIMNECDCANMDISTSLPTTNVTATNTQIIRAQTVTVNGVVV